jgi:hypothetical protein
LEGSFTLIYKNAEAPGKKPSMFAVAKNESAE